MRGNVMTVLARSCSQNHGTINSQVSLLLVNISETT
ncbi:hypothetical protein DAI22_05g169001 [Oryza sativa Japonica Group]|nr:hypothetical protein DAI22_05g169001 [Oryza sativa Japonica Group]